MQLTFLSLTALLLLAHAAPEASIEDRTLPLGCNETAVIGQVESHSIDLVQPQDDVIGQGWVTATLKVKNVVKGPDVPHVLPVKYFAHTYIRHDLDFMLILHRTDQGFVVTHGQRMLLKPQLSDRCR